MTRIRSRAAFVILAIVLFGLTGAVLSPATVMAKTVTWSSYDVALKLNGDGSFGWVPGEFVRSAGFTPHQAPGLVTRVGQLGPKLAADHPGGAGEEHLHLGAPPLRPARRRA